jgi:iron complex outermembrane recepter protein
MIKRSYFRGGSMLAVVMSLGLAGQAAAQQDAPTDVEEVVVTGSYIAGTP